MARVAIVEPIPITANAMLAYCAEAPQAARSGAGRARSTTGSKSQRRVSKSLTVVKARPTMVAVVGRTSHLPTQVSSAAAEYGIIATRMIPTHNTLKNLSLPFPKQIFALVEHPQQMTQITFDVPSFPRADNGWCTNPSSPKAKLLAVPPVETTHT